MLGADFDYKPKRKYISHSPDETIEFRNLTRFEGNRLNCVWSVDGVKASEDWDFSTQLTPGEHVIKLTVRNGDITDSKLENMEVDESGLSFPENQLNVRLKGIDFTPGFRDGAWKPLSEEQMEEDLDVINRELGCNAVRIFGDIDGLIIRCAEIALTKSFDCIVLAPRYIDATVEETVKRVGTFAEQAEKLRQSSHAVELCVANELSIEALNLVPGGGGYESRAFKANTADWSLFNKVLTNLVAVSKKSFMGKISYSAGFWESVNWSRLGFDVIGSNEYLWTTRMGSIESKLEQLKSFGKPIYVGEFGSCSYSGACKWGGAGWAYLDKGPYNEVEQKECIEKSYLKVFNRTRPDAVFLYVYKDWHERGFGILSSPVENHITSMAPYMGRWRRKLAFHLYEGYKRVGS